MKRLHLHVTCRTWPVDPIYEILGAPPSVVKDDMPWMLDDPRELRDLGARPAGRRHVGIQVDLGWELRAVRRLKAAGAQTFGRGGDHLLLRQVRQELGRRSGGRALGDYTFGEATTYGTSDALAALCAAAKPAESGVAARRRPGRAGHRQAPAADDGNSTAVEGLSALAHEGRREVFRLLVRAGPEGMRR
jgi:hypothetical protein